MNQWNAELYQNKHSFVWQYGAQLIELLAPRSAEVILDLGCGAGQLTSQIANLGAEVIGLDNSSELIAQAQANYPQIKFQLADGANFISDRAFDAVFSNAALHWIQPPEAVIRCIWQVLKPGGRFIAEFGGKGNVRHIIQAFNTALIAVADCPPYNPWYFPSIAEYSQLLEQQGFEVTYASLFNRPTKLAGEEGLKNWLNMFAAVCLARVSAANRQQIIRQTESQLRSTLYDDGHWTADYRRIRIVAVKP